MGGHVAGAWHPCASSSPHVLCCSYRRPYLLQSGQRAPHSSLASSSALTACPARHRGQPPWPATELPHSTWSCCSSASPPLLAAVWSFSPRAAPSVLLFSHRPRPLVPFGGAGGAAAASCMSRPPGTTSSQAEWSSACVKASWCSPTTPSLPTWPPFAGTGSAPASPLFSGRPGTPC